MTLRSSKPVGKTKKVRAKFQLTMAFTCFFIGLPLSVINAVASALAGSIVETLFNWGMCLLMIYLGYMNFKIYKVSNRY